MNTTTNLYPKLTQAFNQVGVELPAILSEKFQRVLQKIELYWGSKDAIRYLDSLLFDDYEQHEDREDRLGFPPEVMRELVLVKQTHDFLFPLLDGSPFDPSNVTHPILRPQEIPASDAANLIEFDSRSAQGSNLEHNASDHPKADQAETASPALPADVPAIAMPVKNRVNWPKVRTEHELFEYAELLHGSEGRIYAHQGKMLGEILTHYKLVDARNMELVEHIQRRAQYQNKAIGQILVEIGIINSEELVCALCIQAGIIMVDVLTIPISPATAKTVPLETAYAKQVLPVGIYNNSLFLAVADPFAFNDKSFFTMLTGLKVEPVYAPRHEIINRLNAHGSSKSTIEAQEEFHTLAMKTLDIAPGKPVANAPPRDDVSENDSAIINLVNQMILHAIDEGASDIHIEQFEGDTISGIRFRRDGNMEHFSDFPGAYHNAVISRIKIMAGLDIAEKRHPQDGKISFTLREGKRVDLRVATVPTINGLEFVTIRILSSGEPLPLAALGMAYRDMTDFREVFQKPYGLILVCGPTGSGKTTTLHSVLRELNTDDRKIWTAEDPVEIVQPHLCQVQVNSKIDLTFANVLRSFLRADPDIIMIGEMRDHETAKIALEASMTGHLVLSTLHTNSASETVARLIDLDIDPYNLSDALLAILAQRLARKLCSVCAVREEASAPELEDIANEYHQSAHSRPASMAERKAIIKQWQENFGDDGNLYLKHPVGCDMCNGGYKGRVGLYELLQVTPALRHLIRQHAAASEYMKSGIADGMRTLKQDGIEKVLRGITDMVQVHSACI